MEFLELEYTNPVLYWKRRSEEALVSQGVVVPPPPPPLRNPVLRQPKKLPVAVIHVRHRNERVGLDLICQICQRHIPKSTQLFISCHFYSPHGPMGSPLTRCYLSCPHCYNGCVLGRHIGDADNFVVIQGAIQQFPSGDLNTTEPEPDLQNEASYPDAVLDSPNDVELSTPGREWPAEELELRLRRKQRLLG